MARVNGRRRTMRMLLRAGGSRRCRLATEGSAAPRPRVMTRRLTVRGGSGRAVFSPSWPGVSRPSTPRRRSADGRDTPGHDERETTWLRQPAYPDTHGNAPDHDDGETTWLRPPRCSDTGVTDSAAASGQAGDYPAVVAAPGEPSETSTTPVAALGQPAPAVASALREPSETPTVPVAAPGQPAPAMASALMEPAETPTSPVAAPGQ